MRPNTKLGNIVLRKAILEEVQEEIEDHMRVTSQVFTPTDKISSMNMNSIFKFNKKGANTNSKIFNNNIISNSNDKNNINHNNNRYITEHIQS